MQVNLRHRHLQSPLVQCKRHAAGPPVAGLFHVRVQLPLQRCRGVCVGPGDPQLYDIDGRIYLEVERFDRVGSRGRRPNLSLEAVDAEFVGSLRSWTESAQQLHEAERLDSDSLERIRWLDLFGAWIENSDRHPGNLSLMPADDGFVLHPVYDMLPMAHAPVRGEIRETVFRPPVASRLGDGMALWQSTGEAAVTYWQRLADDRRLSDGFRALARDRRERIQAALVDATGR